MGPWRGLEAAALECYHPMKKGQPAANQQGRSVGGCVNSWALRRQLRRQPHAGGYPGADVLRQAPPSDGWMSGHGAVFKEAVCEVFQVYSNECPPVVWGGVVSPFFCLSLFTEDCGSATTHLSPANGCVEAFDYLRKPLAIYLVAVKASHSIPLW